MAKNKYVLSLSVGDRIRISDLFPRESNLVTMTISRGIMEEVRLSKEEMEEIGWEADLKSGGISWKKDKMKVVELSNVEYDFLIEQINKLDKQEKITAEIYDVVMKIKEAKDAKPQHDEEV